MEGIDRIEGCQGHASRVLICRAWTAGRIALTWLSSGAGAPGRSNWIRRGWGGESLFGSAEGRAEMVREEL